ncbi:MAG: PorT family protein [Saprospiraceae bacterium]|nr:MAG: PorT family protein [Saprospiraceae bacterium]
MKKIVAIAAFFLLMQAFISAQTTDLRLGFQVSPVLSYMGSTDNKINSNGTNLGLKLGMRAEMFFRENYAFITGIGFAFNSGGTLHHDIGGQIWTHSELPNGVDPTFLPGVDLKYNLQYVEIPLGLKFRTNDFGYLRYWAEIPVITLGFKSQASGAIQQTGITEDKIDIKKEVTSLSLSWGIAGGMEYNISSGTSLVGGIGFEKVFTDVTKDVDDDKSKGFINNLVLRLGVLF